jgi:hypothetical protein
MHHAGLLWLHLILKDACQMQPCQGTAGNVQHPLRIMEGDRNIGREGCEKNGGEDES